MSARGAKEVKEYPKTSKDSSNRSKSSSRSDMDANQSGKSTSRRSSVLEASKHRSASAISRDERRRAAKYESKKDKAVEPAEGAEEAAKDNSTPTGKRKGDEVFSP